MVQINTGSIRLCLLSGSWRAWTVLKQVQRPIAADVAPVSCRECVRLRCLSCFVWIHRTMYFLSVRLHHNPARPCARHIGIGDVHTILEVFRYLILYSVLNFVQFRDIQCGDSSCILNTRFFKLRGSLSIRYLPYCLVEVTPQPTISRSRIDSS